MLLDLTILSDIIKIITLINNNINLMSQNFFSVIVVGDNPQQLLSVYDSNHKVEPYIKYKFQDAQNIQENEIKVLKSLIKTNKLNSMDEINIRQRLREIEKLSPHDYFDLLGYDEEIDDEGNILSTENPLGKYEWCEIGKRFSTPFILKNGSKTFQALKKDISWNEMHLNNQFTYETVWELIMEGKEPTTEEEKTLYNNMQNLDNYFAHFKSKEDYVLYNTSFFHYAFLNKDGWQDMDDAKSDKEWVTKFYQKFIEPLDDNSLLTVYECKKNTN